MVIQGCTSAYAIWSQLKQEAKDSGHEKEIIAYKNVNVRLTKLVKLEYITEIAPHTYTQHGRRDYKVTMKGFELLIPYILTHPKEMKNIINYMDKFKIDKKEFGELLGVQLGYILEAANRYRKFTKLPIIASVDSKYAGPFWRTTLSVGDSDDGYFYDVDTKLRLDEEKGYQPKVEPLDEAIRFLIEDLRELMEIFEEANESLKIEIRNVREREMISDTKKTLDSTIADAHKAAETFRQTVKEMKEKPNFQETIKSTHTFEYERS